MSQGPAVSLTSCVRAFGRSGGNAQCDSIVLGFQNFQINSAHAQ